MRSAPINNVTLILVIMAVVSVSVYFYCGAQLKLMNVDTLKKLGWIYSIELKDGLASTYEWFLAHQDDFRG